MLLPMVLSLVNVKARYRWSDKSLTSLLQVVQDMLPEENTLSKTYYQVKKIPCLMGMEYQKIHAYLMIAYCTKMSLKKCITAPGVGYQGTKWRMMTSVAVMKAPRKAPQRRCYGIFQSFQGSSICLLMQMTQKTLHDMQMEEIAMECSTIQLIPLSGRRLIVSI